MNISINPNNLKINIISIIYSLLITFSTDLFNYDDEEIKDRVRYLKLFENLEDFIIGTYLNEGIISTIFNDSLFFLICYILGFFFTPKNGLRLIIFISSFLISNTIIKNSKGGFFYNLIFLINPYLTLCLILNIRQALALSIFVFSFYTFRGFKRNLFFIFSCLNHTSYFLIIFLNWISLFLIKIKSSIFERSILLSMALTIFSTSFFMLSTLIPARQLKEFANLGSDGSGIGFIAWLIILILFILNEKNILKKNHSFNFSIVSIILFLSSYFFLNFSFRVLIGTLPIIMISTKYLPKFQRQIILFLLTIETIYVYTFTWESFLIYK